MSIEPIVLTDALASFEALWSPRIVTRVNDYDVRIAKVSGDYVWHAHEHTDEFFLVLDGELRIGLRDGVAANAEAGTGQAERVVVLPRGAVFVVPRGIEHRPFSPNEASILMFEPIGTVTVGDQHDVIPDHIDASTGQMLD